MQHKMLNMVNTNHTWDNITWSGNTTTTRPNNPNWINTDYIYDTYGSSLDNVGVKGTGPLEQFNDKLKSLEWRTSSEKSFLINQSIKITNIYDFMDFILENEFNGTVHYLIDNDIGKTVIYVICKNKEDKALVILRFK